jgi:predicted RNase H-like nuclease (RuvC/YqgF family)
MPNTPDLEKQIKELEKQIKALKAQNKTALPPKKREIVMLTPSIRLEREKAAIAELQRKLAKELANNPLHNLTPTEVVSAYAGGLADLPDLDVSLD